MESLEKMDNLTFYQFHDLAQHVLTNLIESLNKEIKSSNEKEAVLFPNEEALNVTSYVV